MANSDSINDVQTTTKGKAKSNKAKLKETLKNAILTYPPNLANEKTQSDGHASYLVMRSMQLTNKTRNHFFDARQELTKTKGKLNFDFLTTINLYMPPIVENIQQDYDTGQQSLVGQFAMEVVNGGTSLKDIGGAVAKGAGMVVGSAIRGFLGHFSDAYQQQSGKIVSPNIVGAYSGPQRRMQTLTFMFNPKSLPELKMVADIIKALHIGALPDMQGFVNTGDILDTSNADFNAGLDQALVTYGVPPLWYLEEVSTITQSTQQTKEYNRYTPRFIFGPAAITSIRMNKTPDQFWRTFKGTAGDSASIELEVSFTEMFPMDQTTYANDVFSDISAYTGETQ